MVTDHEATVTDGNVWPFDSAEAARRQDETAERLGLDKVISLDLGGGETMKCVLIPAGEFDMGSPASETERNDGEGPLHRVRISKPFYMSVTEVTQGQYEAITGDTPSHFSNAGSDAPVEMVSWDDAVSFCEQASSGSGRVVRLPTEAEWEYACRAGTATPFHTGDTLSADEANYDGNYPYDTDAKGVYRETTIAVGSFDANAFGLHDMHGNVLEWCSDWYDKDYYEAFANACAVDPQAGVPSGKTRILRGGSWCYYAGYARSANRGHGTPGAPGGRYYGIGFRVVVDAER